MGRIFEKRKHSIFKTALQNSKLYSRYSKQIYMAAKNGVPDPHANPVLRTFVLATIAVPIVIYGLMPHLHGLRARLLNRQISR